MNENASQNYTALKLSALYLPILLLILVVAFLYTQNALSAIPYTLIQKDLFLFLNAILSQFPSIQNNLTQLGDALIFSSFLGLFIIYAPKVWEALISASLVSVLFCSLLKKLFAVPRPAATFDNESFVIIGQTLNGHNSLPSGHAITIFTTLTVLLFAFMPKEIKYKCLWCFLIVALGMILVSTRIGVGAHYPIDVIVGSIIGYISGLIGIFINQKYKIWAWVSNRKYYPIFIVLFIICCSFLINKLVKDNLIIYYFSLASVLTSLYIITNVHVKEKFKFKSLRINNKLS